MDDIGEVGPDRRGHGSGGGVLVRRCRRFIQAEPVAGEVRRQVRQLVPVRDADRRIRHVGQHRGHALRGLRRVQREEGSTRLEDAQQRHHQVLGAVQQDGHDDLGPHAEPLQPVRQAVGPAVEFGIGQLAVVVGDRDGVREALDRRGDHLMQAGRPVVDDLGLVPGGPLTTLLLGEQRQLRDPPAGIGDDAAEEGGEVPGHPLDRGGIEEVGVVLQYAGQLPAVFAYLHHQIERGATLPDVEGFQPQPPRTRGGLVGEAARLFPGERDLEQRRAAGVAHRPEPLNEQREGEVLVCEGALHGVLDAAEKGDERRIVAQVGAQGHRVGEVTDQTLQRDPVTAREG